MDHYLFQHVVMANRVETFLLKVKHCRYYYLEEQKK